MPTLRDNGTISGLRDHQHAHVCGCGDFFVCNGGHDRCAIPHDWTCPNCDLAQMDDYYSRLLAQQHPQTDSDGF